MQKAKLSLKNFKRFFTLFEKENISYSNLICGFIVFAASFYYTLQMPLDYGAHLYLADQFSFSNFVDSILNNTYPLWHVLCILIKRIFDIPGNYASAFSTSIFVYLTYYISRKIILTFVHNDFGRKCAGFFSAMLMFVQPIYIPWFNESHLIGQGSPNILYNPTNAAVKPFAIICVWLFIKICNKNKQNNYIVKNNWMDYVQLAFFEFISVLAKPSFAQVCIPAIGIYLLYTLIKTKGRSFIFCAKIALTWVPSVLWMAMIFFLSFISSTSSDGNGVALSFFDVWNVYSPCVPISILLATLFPVIILIISLKKREITDKLGLYLSALMVFIGIWEYGLLMETGNRMLHGNFSWGYVVGLGVIWTYATGMLVSHISRAKEDVLIKSKGWAFAYLVFIAHFVFGVYYYFITL